MAELNHLCKIQCAERKNVLYLFLKHQNPRVISKPKVELLTTSQLSPCLEILLSRNFSDKSHQQQTTLGSKWLGNFIPKKKKKEPDVALLTTRSRLPLDVGHIPVTRKPFTSSLPTVVCQPSFLEYFCQKWDVGFWWFWCNDQNFIL